MSFRAPQTVISSEAEKSEPVAGSNGAIHERPRPSFRTPIRNPGARGYAQTATRPLQPEPAAPTTAKPTLATFILSWGLSKAIIIPSPSKCHFERSREI